MVRELARRALEQHGYQVLQAESGEAALLLSGEYGAVIDLLLTDVVMPGALNGRELAERLLALRPALKVMYMSGYADSALVRQEIAETDRAFLAKPFTASGLLSRVGAALAGWPADRR